MGRQPPSLSVVVPVYNEEESLRELVAGILKSEEHVGRVEIILVDDGSTDDSAATIKEMCQSDKRIRLICLLGNQGKAAALQAGFLEARGEMVITMDADLQDDPSEIPRFLAKLDEGYDVVSGWKVERFDPWHKTGPSKIFNFVVRRLFGIGLHDFNCGFKAYRRSMLKNLHLYGELHRYIPVLLGPYGARITEIPVSHHPRRHGQSKYGCGRLFKGFLDLVTVLVITRFLKRPLHFFGGLGLLLGFIGGLCLAYLAGLWVIGVRPIGNRPLLTYGMLLVIAGGQFFSIGVLAEFMMRLVGRSEGPAIGTKVGFE